MSSRVGKRFIKGKVVKKHEAPTGIRTREPLNTKAHRELLSLVTSAAKLTVGGRNHCTWTGHKTNLGSTMSCQCNQH